MALSWRFIEAAPDAVVISDREGTIVEVNAQVERLYGYSRGELLGSKVELLVPERSRDVHVMHRGAFVSEASFRPMGAGMPLYGRRKDGSEFPVEVKLNPVETDVGLRVVAAVKDLSERRRLEAAARAADELMRQAVEIQEDAFAVFDRHGLLLLHNGAYRALMPESLKGPLTGRSIAEIVECTTAASAFESEEARSLFRARYLEALRTESGTDPLFHDGRVFRVTRRCTQNSELVVTIADRTEDERGVEALRRASAAKTEFLSAMSHELRTPLHAILGFASLLMRDRRTPLADRQREMVQHILKGCDHLMHLVDDVLDLSQIESGRMMLSTERVDLPVVLSEVVTALRPDALRAGVSLHLAPCDDDLPTVFADRSRIVQVLKHFGSNAIKYGRPGGRATFGAERADEGLVRLFVEDDGVGIAEEWHPQIFQPFQRAGQEMGPIEGIGIGLALSQRLASLMDGRVGFRSAAGEGATFWLELRALQEGLLVR
ncbi:MAG: PAS domain S-box protein [Deltaproteobacteria bacterium]|nr:PAS domain S-box protein [Deltaproteobacteria bacterium]